MLLNLDIIGSIFSFLSTIFYVLAFEICWPIGIIATLVNGILYGLSGIYGDMCLECIYFISMFYGWYEWRYGGKGHKTLLVQRIRWPTVVLLMGVAMLGIGVTYSVLKFALHSQVAIMDSVTTVLSLVAQWMICVKMLECWIVWFVVDAIYVALYFDRHLPVHSLLLLVYLGMAVAGYWRWSILYRNQLQWSMQHGANNNS